MQPNLMSSYSEGMFFTVQGVTLADHNYLFYLSTIIPILLLAHGMIGDSNFYECTSLFDRWRNTEYQYMDVNRVNGINLPAGL